MSFCPSVRPWAIGHFYVQWALVEYFAAVGYTPYSLSYLLVVSLAFLTFNPTTPDSLCCSLGYFSCPLLYCWLFCPYLLGCHVLLGIVYVLLGIVHLSRADGLDIPNLRFVQLLRTKTQQIPICRYVRPCLRMIIYWILYMSRRSLLGIGFDGMGYRVACLDYFGRVLIFSQKGFVHHVSEINVR